MNDDPVFDVEVDIELGTVIFVVGATENGNPDELWVVANVGIEFVDDEPNEKGDEEFVVVVVVVVKFVVEVVLLLLNKGHVFVEGFIVELIDDVVPNENGCVD